MITKLLVENKYVPAAAALAEFEIWLRLLGDKVKIEQDLKSVDLIKCLFDRGYITADDKVLLDDMRKLRNKVLHIVFPDARDIVGKLGSTLAQGNVWVARIGETPDVLATIQNTTQSQRVSEIDQREAGIAGWLMEGATSGLFDEAVSHARQAIERICQLFPE